MMSQIEHVHVSVPAKDKLVSITEIRIDSVPVDIYMYEINYHIGVHLHMFFTTLDISSMGHWSS